MVHVVHVEAGRHLYGGPHQVLMLLRGLPAHGVESTLVCAPDSEIATAAAGVGIRVQTLPLGGDLDALFAYRFARWLRGTPADLIHVHSRRGADLWGGRAANHVSLPAVLSRRVDNLDIPLLGTLKYRLYDRVVGISSKIVDVLRTQGVPADKLRLVRSAIDAELCSPAWSDAEFRTAFDIPENASVVVCVAQFIPRKGHADLLHAWHRVVAKMPDARLLLFGRGPLERAIRRQTAELDLCGSVCMAGFRTDLRQFLGRADLLVHPPHREGLGVAVLEAKAAGLPVVATRAGGIPEAVADGVTGLLVEPGDRRALAGAIERLLADAELRARLGAAGKARVAAEFSPTAMVAGNVAVYRELLGSERMPG